MDILPDIPIREGDNFHFERELAARGYKRITGVDEVGRGPLAGPVVAACVCLPEGCDATPFVDSKVTTERQRGKLSELLVSYHASIGIGIVSHHYIDSHNILVASLTAMKLAVHHLSLTVGEPGFLLVDGKFEVPLSIPQLPLIKGERKSASIAAASIVAKLCRDRIMDRLHSRYPRYNFRQHKGYPTKQHRSAVANFGPCPIHRRSFKGVKEFVA